MLSINNFISEVFSLENHENSYFDFDKIKDLSYEEHERYNTLLMNPVTEKQIKDMELHPEGYIEENLQLYWFDFKIIASRYPLDYSRHKELTGTWMGEIYIRSQNCFGSDIDDVKRLVMNKIHIKNPRKVYFLPDSKRIQVKFSDPKLGDYTPFGDMSLCKDKEASYFCGDDAMEWLKEFVYELFN
jgi:hypothetical protein